MTTESFYSLAGTFGGSFFGSFLVGYFIKRIFKIMFVLGGILALLMYLQSQGIVNVSVNVERIQSSVEGVINTIAANTTSVLTTDNNPSIITNNLGIPLTGTITSGFILGLTRRG